MLGCAGSLRCHDRPSGWVAPPPLGAWQRAYWGGTFGSAAHLFPTRRVPAGPRAGNHASLKPLDLPERPKLRAAGSHGYARPLRRRRASRVPHVAFPASRSRYPGGFFAAASPSASRLPRPSPLKPGLGSPLSSSRRAHLSGRQDSAISRTGCRFARRPQATLSRRFDAGISPARQPPATRLLGRYLGRACTGWSHGASSRYTR